MKFDNPRLEVITDPARFKDVKQPWETLYGSAIEHFPTVSHAWLAAWWEAFGADAALHIVLVWQDDRLICGAPFFYSRRKRLGKIRNIVSLFTNSWVDRSTILVSAGEEHALEIVFDHLLNDAPSWECLEMDRLDPASEITRQFRTLLQERRLRVGIDPSLHSPYLALPENWEELLQALSPSFRQSVQRKCRKAQKINNLSLSIRKDASVADAIMEISLQSWQHDNGSSMATKPHIRKFYEAIIDDAASTGTLYVGMLEVDGIPVAFDFNIACGPTLHNFKLGYRKDYADWSPGLVLKAYVIDNYIKECAAQKIKSAEYDFMGTSAPYKRNWSKEVREHISIIACRSNWDLLPFYFFQYKLKPGLRQHFPWLIKLKNFRQRAASDS